MKLAFCTKSHRPACVILQAAFGCGIMDSKFRRLFPAETWLTSLTPEMRVYEATDEQLEILSERAKRAVKKA